MSATAPQRQITSKMHCTTKESVVCLSQLFYIGRINFSTSFAMRRKRWLTAHKYLNYSGGSKALNYRTHSSLLKLGINLTALLIWRRINISQPLYPIRQIINGTKFFLVFRLFDTTVGETVDAAAQVKVVATVAESTIPRGRSTQALTRIGNA